MSKIQIPVTSRRDYELYIKSQVAAMHISNKQKQIVRTAIMNGFDDGIAFKNGDLIIETDGDQ